MIIGFCIEKPTYKKTLLCKIGIHKPSKYVFEKDENTNEMFFVCAKCGTRIRILPL